MNERIKLLALQAKLGSALLLHHWGTVDALTDSEQQALVQIEKFAELIVRECLVIVNRKEYSYHEAYPLWETAELIKEHFGVDK